MGKHDIKEPIRVTANVMPDEFYKARIETLERELMAANKEIEALEHKITMLEAVIGEYKTDMGDLIVENNSLRDAVVRAALREVEA